MRRFACIWALLIPAMLGAAGCGGDEPAPPPGAPDAAPSLSIDVPDEGQGTTPEVPSDTEAPDGGQGDP